MSGGTWLGPTVESCLDRYRAEGHGDVVIAPIGFVCDHVEILYDIDVHFRDYAAARGIRITRPESLNGSPTFTAALAEVVGRCPVGNNCPMAHTNWSRARQQAGHPATLLGSVEEHPRNRAATVRERGTQRLPAPSRSWLRCCPPGCLTSVIAAGGGISGTVYPLLTTWPRGGAGLHDHRIAPAAGRCHPDRARRGLHHRGRAGQLSLGQTGGPRIDPRPGPGGRRDRLQRPSAHHLRPPAAAWCLCPTG